ncbi:MAG: hypothetical protein OHK0046_05120 [Anaerolineae bacterium]
MEENGNNTPWSIIGMVMGIVAVTVLIALIIVLTFALTAGGGETQAATGTIVDVAVANSDFGTLVEAVTAAGLVEALSGEGPYTVFAPTNEAFETALESLGLTAEDLLADTDLLTAILQYHVIPGEVPAETVLTLDGESVETLLEGRTIDISVMDGTVVLNGSVNVVATDVQASNGIVHVIDGVLLPIALSEGE